MKTVLQPGDRVKMVKCLESRLSKNKDRTWKVISEPWNLCGADVVLLEGRSGGFATRYLEKVSN